MSDRSQNPTVSPWLLAGVGAAMVGIWWFGRRLGESIEDEYESNPDGGITDGRLPNPAESAWLETRPYVVPRTMPVERVPLPHECNPVDPSSLGPGRVCVAAGNLFISVNPSSQHHVKKPGPTEVAFSENLQHYKVGDAWGRGVLDRWLLDLPAVNVGPRESPVRVWMALYAAGWPMSIGEIFIHVPSGIALLRAFAETHYVKTPVGTMRIIDLPATPATTAFREYIATQIAKAAS